MDQKLVPKLHQPQSSRYGEELERFSHYVARQIGFNDPSECPMLCKLANDYLKKSKESESSIYSFFSSEPEPELLLARLIEEFDKCILSYFSFHWNLTSSMISQALGNNDHEKKRFKNLVMAATRKQRFDKVVKDLKVARVFTTLVEEMKAIGEIKTNGSSSNAESVTEVMVPVAHNKRSPVLLLMGGGMGAGKSTVLKEILNEPFWSGVGDNVVVVEADAFKETDVIYKAISSRGHHADMLQTAQLVHQPSLHAAESLLVTALNNGRDVILDGTMSWVPFVEQTIAMARNVHKSTYRMGYGYKKAEDGTEIENYWEIVEETDVACEQKEGRKPYRIELVGVVCDAYLAVVRGIRRAIMVGRAVGVKSQLMSHKRFASAFPYYCQLVDNARLYCTNPVCGPPRLIGWKDGDSRLLVDVEEIPCLNILGTLNEDANSIYDLHTNQTPLSHPGSAWKEMILSPSRPNLQLHLKTVIAKCEARFA